MEELFVADRQVERQSLYYAVTAVTRSVVIITTAWYTRDVGAIIWALTIFAAAKAVFALVYTKAVYHPSIRQVSLSTIREQISFALPLGLMGVATLLLSQTDRFIINRMLGREAFAIYTVGAHQLPFATIIASSVASVTFPLMAQLQKEGRFDDFVDLWRRAWLKTAVLFFPICVFLIVTADQFIRILFTNAYSDAVPVFRIYLLLFLNATTDYGGVLAAFKQQKYLLQITAAAVAVNIVLSLVMFQLWGRLGVPLSTAIVFFSIGVLSVRKGSGLLVRSFWQIVPWRGLTKRAAAAVVPGAVLYVFYARHGRYNIWEYVVTGLLYFAGYFLICWLSGLLRPEDIRSLLGKPKASS
jgi:O-antigen/teichoic acid export membrane protein